MAATSRHNKRWSEEKISSAVLIVLLTMSVIMFALFFGVDYDTPWDENTEFINPAFTDSLINFMFFMTGAACIAVIASAAWFMRCRGHVLDIMWGVPAGWISICVVILLVVTLAITYLTASDSAILINGRSYTDSLWLNITDMLIHTSEVLLVLAVAAVIYGMSGINRRIQKH